MSDNKDWEKIGGGEQVDAWTPAEGDELVGVYVEKRTDLGAKKSTMYIVEQEDGVKTGVWDTAVLKDRFSHVAIGDTVKIVYQGKTVSKTTGNQVKSFEFYAKKGTGTPAATASTPAVADDLPF